jgi:hypothetical protein
MLNTYMGFQNTRDKLRPLLVFSMFGIGIILFGMLLICCAQKKQEPLSRAEDPATAHEFLSGTVDQLGEYQGYVNEKELPLPSWCRTIIHLDPSAIGSQQLPIGSYELEQLSLTLDQFGVIWKSDIRGIYVFSARLFPVSHLSKDFVMVIYGDFNEGISRFEAFFEQPERSDRVSEWQQRTLINDTPVYYRTHEQIGVALVNTDVIMVTSSNRMKDGLKLIYGKLEQSLAFENPHFYDTYLHTKGYQALQVAVDVRVQALRFQQKAKDLSFPPNSATLDRESESHQQSMQDYERLERRQALLHTLGEIEYVAFGTHYGTQALLGIYAYCKTTEGTRSLKQELNQILELDFIKKQLDIASLLDSVRLSSQGNLVRLELQVKADELSNIFGEK